ncbi:hypothetical protein HNS03_07220 [Amorphus sp. 3PC139-8]
MPTALQAVELHEIEVRRGTDGLVHAPIELANDGTRALSCTAQLAHWYSEAVAEVPAGASRSIDLWFDPATASFVRLNALEDNMPVEALWCGAAGKAYETRAALPLPRDDAGPRRIVCAATEQSTTCE